MQHKHTRFLLLMLFFSCTLSLTAQDKEPFKKKTLLKEIKTFNKAKNYAKAEETLRKAFAQYPEAKADPELMNYEVNAQYELMLQENRKIYLKTNPDTVKYFSYVLKTYAYALACDSLDQQPNTKGQIRPSYSSNLTDKLTSLRNNLRSGGKFHYKKKNYAEAYPFFDMYLSTIGHPLLTKNAKATSPLDVDSVEMAQAAVISAYGAAQYQNAVKYLHIAVLDTANRSLMYELGAKSYEQLQQNLDYVSLLKQGLTEYPRTEYFYASLIQYYNEQESYHQALDMINEALAADTLNHKLWYLKGRQCQFLNQLDQAIEAYQQVLVLQPENAEAYAAIGELHLQQAHDFYDKTDLRIGAANYSRNRRRLNAYYQQALNAYESSRQFAPDNTKLWLEGLREVYYKLGEGKKLRELE